VGHDGALFGYRTGILRFPEQRFTAVCLCNLSSASPTNILHKVADVYLEKNLQPEAETLQSPGGSSFPDPKKFAGRYMDPRKHFVYSFTAADGNLIAWGSSLRRVGPNQFKDLGTGTITFDESGKGMTATLEMDGEAFFAGKRIENLHPSATDLEAYAGRYKSEDLDTTYTLSVSNGNLVVRNKWDPPLTLSPVAQDEFENENLGTIVFRRDANHRVSGLSVFEVSARNVSFEKSN